MKRSFARGAEKFPAVAAVAHGAGGDGAEVLRAERGRFDTEGAERVERPGHCLGPELARADELLGETRADA
jgi:hypothetical protein